MMQCNALWRKLSVHIGNNQLASSCDHLISIDYDASNMSRVFLAGYCDWQEPSTELGGPLG